MMLTYYNINERCRAVHIEDKALLPTTPHPLVFWQIAFCSGTDKNKGKFSAAKAPCSGAITRSRDRGDSVKTVIT